MCLNSPLSYISTEYLRNINNSMLQLMQLSWVVGDNYISRICSFRNH